VPYEVDVGVLAEKPVFPWFEGNEDEDEEEGNEQCSRIERNVTEDRHAGNHAGEEDTRERSRDSYDDG